ncbi:nuclear transport factor 2 family protein [Streptomyces sp. NPDC016845]|uniref:nuclear transport factor 2 family protein n=1 Tax=Streptomyces sp. NPDC016845 TaxID=3364972 RepID=UPI00379279E1
MPMQTAKLSDPAVRAFVSALNAHDQEAFRAALAPDATMADDGSDHDLADWSAREIFDSHGHMEIEKETAGGRALVANYRNDAWGEMRTKWTFDVANGKVVRFETGQA